MVKTDVGIKLEELEKTAEESVARTKKIYDQLSEEEKKSEVEKLIKLLLKSGFEFSSSYSHGINYVKKGINVNISICDTDRDKVDLLLINRRSMEKEKKE